MRIFPIILSGGAGTRLWPLSRSLYPKQFLNLGNEEESLLEATLKRLRRKGASIALEAANPAYETRIFTQDRVKVQGRLVGLIRRY